MSKSIVSATRLFALLNEQHKQFNKPSTKTAAEKCCLRGLTVDCYCSYLHTPSKTVRKTITAVENSSKRDVDTRTINLLENFSSVLKFLCIVKCPNRPAVEIVEEVAIQLYNIIVELSLTNYKCYAAVYYTLRTLPSEMLSFIAFQQSAWLSLEEGAGDMMRQDMIDRLKNASALTTAIETQYSAKERAYFEYSLVSHSDDAHRTLNYQLQDHYASVVRAVNDAGRQNVWILDELRKQLQTLFTDYTVELTAFGSRISHLGGLESDLDVSLSFYRVEAATNTRRYRRICIDNRGVPPGTPASHLRTSRILNSMRGIGRMGKFTVHEVITRARIPIVKLKHIATGVELDICIENQLGVQNTLLLQAYAKKDIRIHALLLAVKHWAKQRCVNQSSNGTLSTFSWCLLVLYYLHNVSRPMVAPAFALNAYGKALLLELHAQQSYGTEHCSQPIFELQELLSESSMNSLSLDGDKSVVDLLRGFFAFYGVDTADSFDFMKEEVNLRLDVRSNHNFQATQPMVSDQVDDFSDHEEDQEAEVDPDSAPFSQETSTNASTAATATALSSADITSPSAVVSRGSQDRRSSRKGGAQNFDWRVKVRDPFVDWDLGRVVRNVEAQHFMQNELRRGFALLCDHSALLQQQPSLRLWDVLTERHPDLPNGFCICPRCGQLGHLKNFCPLNFCDRCKQKGHSALVCSHVRGNQRDQLVGTAVQAETPPLPASNTPTNVSTGAILSDASQQGSKRKSKDPKASGSKSRAQDVPAKSTSTLVAATVSESSVADQRQPRGPPGSTGQLPSSPVISSISSPDRTSEITSNNQRPTAEDKSKKYQDFKQQQQHQHERAPSTNPIDQALTAPRKSRVQSRPQPQPTPPPPPPSQTAPQSLHLNDGMRSLALSEPTIPKIPAPPAEGGARRKESKRRERRSAMRQQGKGASTTTAIDGAGPVASST